jgi:membrane-associated phospholipid phosphatase
MNDSKGVSHHLGRLRVRWTGSRVGESAERATDPVAATPGPGPLDELSGAASRARRRLAAVWILAAIACLAIDVPLAQFFKADSTPNEIRRLLHRAETFGHAYGVLAIVITVGVLDAVRRPRTARLLVASLGAGLMADLSKIVILRTRPRFYDLSGGLWDSFVGLAWWNSAGDWRLMFDNTQQSFPSAHTAVAVGLATCLTILYPQGRRWFAALAFLCAMNRVDGCAHFASDACVGAAVGIVVADWALSSHRTTTWMDRLHPGSWRRGQRTRPSYQVIALPAPGQVERAG